MLKHSEPKDLRIAARAYAQPVAKSKKKKRSYSGGLNKPSKWTLVFDTETTADEAFTLRLGVCHLYRGETLHEKYLFFDPNPVNAKVLTAKDIGLIRAYASEKGFIICTTTEFINLVVYRYGYRYGGAIVGFNLPFDLSRLAIESDSARGRMRGGFTLKLHADKRNPRIRIKHLSSRAALVSFAAPPEARDGRSSRKRKLHIPPRRGFFVDVKTLAATLTGASHSLQTLTEYLGIKAKLKVERHGRKITRHYLNYAVRDVEITARAYFRLIADFAPFGLAQTEPHQLYSEASLGKGHLREMGIKPLAEVQSDLPPELLGIIMSSYYGGRSEVALRRTISRVLYCDFRSMYPTVCTLMGLWRFVIAKGIEWQEATDEANAILATADFDTVLERDFWKNLTILVQVQADGDLFPVRALYNGQTRSIGLNPLRCAEPLWYTLADVIAAKRLSSDDPEKRKVPCILKAIRFDPKEPQGGLQSIQLQGLADHPIDPLKQDFFREVILLRGQVQSQAKKEACPHRKEQLKGKAQNLKLIANSTSYGIFAEVNVVHHGRLRDVLCFGPNDIPLREQTKVIEEPGNFFHPLIATLITGAARLMLAMTESLVIDNSLDWAFCDTDSLAIVKPDGMEEAAFLQKVKYIRNQLALLDPYGDGKPLLKLEDANFDLADEKKIEKLHCLAISAKRYALFDLNEDGQPVLRKASAHGLGHLRPPYEEKDAPDHLPKPQIPLKDLGVERWQHDLWLKIIEAACAGHPNQVDLSDLPNMDQPTLSRYSASTPDLLNWFDAFNNSKAWDDQVKPFNFLVAFQVSSTARAKAIADGTFDPNWLKNGGPSPVAPFDKDPRRAATKCFDRVTGKPVPKSLLATYREVLFDYHLHAEAKFANGDAFDRGRTERRPVRAIGIELIGKEANRWEEQYFLGQDEDAEITYGSLPSMTMEFHRRLSEVIKTYGLSEVARVAKVSRPSLTKLVTEQGEPTKQMRAKLEDALSHLARTQAGREKKAAIHEHLRYQVGERGLTRLAAELGVDRSNLSAMLAGRRPLSRKVMQMLRR